MSKVTLEWHADDIRSKVRKAIRGGIDTVMAKCVTEAKSRVRVDTATLQGSIRFEPAHEIGDRVRGEWGSYNVAYAIFQEIGPISGARTWAFTPYLRPARDIHYPSLGHEIAARYHG